ncbi:MAG: cytochrome oxidase small assembly protein [Leptothrix sp. (in: b-proteobacteria)]
MSQDTKRQQNRKLGLILASVALVFFIGFIAKIAWLSH